MNFSNFFEVNLSLALNEHFLLFALILGYFQCKAQEEDLFSLLGDEEEVVNYAIANFKTTRIILGQSIENPNGDNRAILSSIYYMLTDDSPIGYFHRNQSDIVHYWHSGSALTYYLIDSDGNFSSQYHGL